VIPFLDPADPGTYAASRGRPIFDSLMVPDVGPGGRYNITTGQQLSGTGEVGMLHSVGFGVFLLVMVLFLIHMRASVAFKAAAGVGK
jgi:hypothetical protein